MANIGWRFELRKDGEAIDTLPLPYTSISHSQGQTASRSIGQVMLVPEAKARWDLIRHQVRAILIRDGNEFPMGEFVAVSSVQHLSAVRVGGIADSLPHVGASDLMTRLVRSTDMTIFRPKNTDPTQLMRDLVQEAGLLSSIAGPTSTIGAPVSWDVGISFAQIIQESAQLAGHRAPWIDNFGVLRSVPAVVVEEETISVLDLTPVDDTVSITEQYLVAPNRIIVVDTDSEFPISGQWNAPSSSPHSESNRGFVQTEVVSEQGLTGQAHAERVAETIGEQRTARSLAFDCLPTHVLDGPVVLRFRGAFWLMNSWSVNTSPGSLMRVSATELPEAGVPTSAE